MSDEVTHTQHGPIDIEKDHEDVNRIAAPRRRKVCAKSFHPVLRELPPALGAGRSETPGALPED